MRAYLTIILLLLFETLNATDYYVNSSTGSNSTGNGTSGNPWKTITYALSQISGTGHTVYVAAGKYNSALGETFPILMKDGVSLSGLGTDTCFIDAGGTNTVIRCTSIIDASTRIEGFLIKGGGNVSDGGGFYISAGSALTIQNNTITLNSADALYVDNSSPLIRRNRIINNNSGRGIHTYGAASSPRIINNIIARNSYGIECTSSAKPKILNNTLSGNTYGVYISGAAPDSIFNNIFSFNENYGIYENSTTSDPGKVSYNLFYSNVLGLYLDEGTKDYFSATDLNTVVPECKNNFSGDPFFINQSIDNYHEGIGSGAIDSGDPSFNYINEPSPNGGRINAGAYGNTSEASTSNTPPTYAIDLYVNANTGNNLTGDGSEANPWKTITFALNQFPASSHIIHVAPGIYNTSLGETFPILLKSGVSISGAGAATTKIDADKTNRVINCIGLTDPATFIEGFTITGGSIAGDFKEGGGIYISAGTSLTLRNNTIINNTLDYWGEGGGIFISESNPTIYNNNISNNTGGVFGKGNAIAMYSSSPRIDKNVMMNNPGSSSLNSSCIYIADYNYSSGSPKIINNVIAKNYQNGIDCYMGTPAIINNTISDNSGHGIYIQWSKPDTINNNIVSYNTGYGIYEYLSSYDPVKVWYNLFFLNGSGLYYDENTTGYFAVTSLNSSVAECKNNLSGDPLFVDKTNNNYHINTGSAAIDAGDIGSPLDPDGSRVDIGAYYYIPLPSAPAANSATSQAQTSLTANWSSSATATGYYLDVATNSSFTSFVTGYNNKDVLNVLTYSITGLTANTPYYYRIRAYNTGGPSGYSNTITTATLPNPPSAAVCTAASSKTQTSFTANWNISATATGYYLDVATDNSFTSFVTGYSNKDVLNVLTYSITGLTLNTPYYYRIRAYNSGGTSGNSNIITTATLPNPPSAAVCTVAGSITQTGFTANWNSSATATGYYLDVATDNGFTSFVTGYNNKDVSNVLSFSVTGLTANSTYYYRVRAYNTGGASDNSNTITPTTLINPPSAPTANNPTDITQTSLTANWNSSATATGYYLDVATNSGFTAFVAGYNNKDVFNVLTYSITGLTLNTTYYYRVRAYNAGGTGSNSNTITTATLPNPPSAAVCTAASSLSQTSFTANWNSSSTATGYYLDVATDNSFTTFVTGYINKDVFNVLSFSVTGLTANSTYYYRVRAYNTGGASDYSNTISPTTLINQPSAPIATDATDITQTSFKANWSSSATATGYYLDVATNSSFTSFVTGYNNTDILNVLTYSITGLTPKGTYYYRVRAYNSGGTSSNSGTIKTNLLAFPVYVNSLTGSNSTGNGTLGNPWKTITYALTQINVTGYTVYVAAGTYNSALGETFPIVMENGVSLVGAGKATTIIDPGKAGRVISCVGITDPSTVIEEFTLTNGYNGSQGGGIFISAGSVLTIRNNIISNNSTGSVGDGGGIYITDSSPLITDNTLSANSAGTSGDGDAIAIINNSSPQIERNTLINNTATNSGSCIYIYGYGSSISPRILNNIIAKNASNGIESYYGNPTIINNTISDNNGDGIYINYNGAPDSVINNIFSFNSGYGIREYGSSTDPGKVLYNLFYFNAAGLYYDEGSTNYYSASSLNTSVAECKNNIEGDPLFVNKGNNDYHLRSFSPAIDAGHPSFSYFYEPSPNGSKIDIGAYGNTNEATSYVTPPVLSTDLYVDASTGSDSTGDGSSGKPWKTITNSLNQITGGEHRIHVAAGTYNSVLGETFPILIKNKVSLVGAGGTATIINAGGANRVLYCVGITDPATTVEGFTIRGGYNGSLGGGIYLGGGSVLRISNNIICNNSTSSVGEGGGIYITNSSPLIISNTISTNSAGISGDGNAISMNNSSPQIERNTIINNTASSSYSSIYVYGSTSSPRIINNVIAKNTNRGIECYYSSPTIINNTISDNTGDGIYLNYSGSPDSIINNIISYNSGYGIKEYGSSSDPGKVFYNLFYTNTTGLYYDEGSTGYFDVSVLNSTVAECKNNLSGDPLFVDKTNNNYHIQLNSPAINSGDPSSPLDPDGSRADIGAYYYIPPPDAPVAVAATSLTHNSFQANWNASATATGYNLDVATDAGFTAFVTGYNNNNITNFTYCSVTGLNPNTTYYYRVRAYNATGTSFSSNVINPATLQIPAPGSPVAIAATNITQTGFSANWNASATATKYYLDVATDSTFISFITGYNNKDVADATTVSVTGLSAYTIYYYRVRAYNAGGNSVSSNTVNLKTLQVLPPGAPTAIAATSITQTSLNANWTASATATGYYLDVATNTGFTVYVPNYNNADVGNVTTFQVTGLATNTTYYYRIRAYNPGGTSSNSIVISPSTLPASPSAPTTNSATNIGQTDFTANWSSSATATGYYLDIATDESFTTFVAGFNNKDIGNLLSFSISGLTANSKYYYRIRAYNTGGTSASSNTITLTTLLNPPPPPSAPVANDATGITQVSLTANWNTTASATGYKLDVATDSTFTTFVTGFNDKDIQNATSCNISGLTANTTYYYRVRGYNSGGASSNSGTETATTLPYPPIAPVSIAANYVAQTSFSANWNTSASAKGYYLDVATDNTFTAFVSGFNNKDVLNVLTYSVTGLAINTTYYYRIRAYNSGGTGNNSNVTTVTTLLNLPAPFAPTAIAATGILTSGFTANWNTSSLATGYKIDVSIYNSFSTYVSGYYNKDVGNVTSTSVTGLSSNYTYYYRVKGYNATGTGSSSNTITVSTLPNPPTAPTALSASSITPTTFIANWVSSSTATGYRLDVSTDNSFTALLDGFNDKDVGNVTSTSVTGLTSDTTYYYRIRAYNSGGTSGNSSTISATPLPDPPSSPVATSASSILQTSFKANWNSSPTATGYYIDVALNSTFTTFLSGYSGKNVGNVTSLVVTGLSSNSIFYYRVKAYNTGGSGSNSNTITVTTLPNPPSAPTALSASTITPTTFVSNWGSVSTATGYRLDISTVSSFASFLAGYNDKDVGNVTSFTVSGLTSDITYYYRLRAYNSGGTSVSSNTISATPLPNPPSNPVAISAGNVIQTAFSARWNSSSTATGYRLDVASDIGFTTLLSGYNNLNIGNVTIFNISGLTAKTVYYYRVRAVNSGGTSGNSNTITVTTLPNPPATPTGLNGTSCNNNVTLTWTANSESDFLRYRIYGGTTTNPTTVIDSTTNQISVTTRTIYGLTKDQTYFFRISALISPGVESALSSSISVKAKTGVIPKIKAKWNDILISYNIGDSISSFQWYYENSAIANANKQNYVTNKKPGKYYVLATDKSGCKNTSNVVTISSTKSYSVYPNPASTKFILSFNSEIQGETVVSIYNPSGLKLLEYRTEKLTPDFYREIPVSSLHEGIFMIEVSVNNEYIIYSRIAIVK
jgi:parallel beta-helix repeat protein